MYSGLLDDLKILEILYVEDENKTRNELASFLNKRVKNFYIAKDGQEGIELYNKFKPNIIISDIQMPLINGVEMAKIIRKKDENIPIVLITAFNNLEYLHSAIEINITDYLKKPLDIMDLLKTLNKISKNISLEKENKEIYNTLKQYKNMVDECSIFFKMDSNGIIKYVNKTFEKITGYSKKELIGLPQSIIRHPDTKYATIQKIWDTTKIDKKLWQGKLKNRKKNGDTFFVNMTIKPILDLKGNIVEFIAMSNDVTELEESKEYFRFQHTKKSKDLTESIRSLNAYSEAINETNMILRIDTYRRITFANEAFLKMTGYTFKELKGEDFAKLKYFDNKTKTPIKMQDIFTDKMWKSEVISYKKNNKKYYSNMVVFPLTNIDERISEYMIVKQDNTKIQELYKELKETQKEIIYSLGEVTETRSMETGYHVKRVAEYSRLLAKKSQLSDEDVNRLFLASPLHDIGKVGISDSILNKPGKLTTDEWKIMKTHTTLGFNILKSSTKDLLKTGAQIAYTHHERWDGTGYPRGLSRDEIPIFGRITALADVFDALATSRVYKKAWEMNRIINFIKREKEKYFDPKLVEIFLSNIDEFLVIKDKYDKKEIEQSKND